MRPWRAIASQGDAVSAQGALQIDGGTFDLTTGEGSESVDMTGSGQPGQRGGRTEQAADAAAQTEEDSVSRKGIKGENTFVINGGSFTVDAEDDCLHAGGAMTIAAGEFVLSSGDDAIHSDGAVTIDRKSVV